jgi:hypothetical protein
MTTRTDGTNLRIVGGSASQPGLARRNPAGYRQFFDLLRQLEIVHRETRADWSPDNLDEARSWLNRLDASMNVDARVRGGK